MATIGYEELPVPAGGDAPTIPAAVAALATALDPRLVHDVVDLADRNARFDGAPQHTLCIAGDGTAWVKTDGGSNTWVTLWEPLPAWQNVTPASGYEHGAYPAQARLVGSQVFLRGRLQRTDAAVIPNNGIAIGEVPVECVPQVQVGSLAAQCSLAGDIEIGVGKLEVLEANSASAYGDPGTLVWWDQETGLETTKGVSWVNISGSYWID